MQPEQWNKVVELFHTLREKDASERSLLLESLCGENHSLCIVVQQMLRNDEGDGTFLARPAAERFAEAASPHHVQATPSARFGRYEVIGAVGRGGMGEVWAARDTELARNVALKFLTPGTPSGYEQHLTREARLASALNHPNIVTIYEVIRHEDTPIVAMELVEGESLRVLCGKPQPVAQVADIGRQIARALAAAHKAGLVHRDIKPENILLRPDGYVKVVDFGLADHTESESMGTGQFAGGTPRYMSPEQASGAPTSPATDVFSLGLVLYELATGWHAFPKASPAEAAHAIQTEEPQPFPAAPAIPRQLQDLLAAMLAKSPTARPAAAEVASELESIATSLSLTTPVAPITTAQSRHLLAIAGLALVVLIGAWLATTRRATPGSQPLAVHPLTSQPGWEQLPAISPDGESVAYIWSEKANGRADLYVRRLNQTEPVRVAGSGPGRLGPIAWSPDGHRLAFVREDGRTNSIRMISSAGGAEQKVLGMHGGNISSSIDWSPDGKYLAFSEMMPGTERLAAYTYNLQTREKRILATPPPGHWGDWSPAFSPDGKTVAIKRVTGFWADEIHLVPATGGTARKLTNIKRGIWGFAWEPDGKSLIVSCQRNSTLFGIWRFFLEKPDQPEMIQQGGADAVAPSMSRKGARAVWVNQLSDLNIYRLDTTRAAKPVRLIASTLRDQGAVYAPDGRIAWVSDRSGSREIWLARSDGTGQVQVTHFNGPQIGSLHWSDDGRWLAFDSRPDGQSTLFVMECGPGPLSCGQPQPLNSVGAAEAPSWSVDRQFLYFTSSRAGQNELWKIPVAGGEPMRVTRNGGSFARESLDGRWLYFTRIQDHSLCRIPAPAYGKDSVAEPEVVVGPPHYKVQTEGWEIAADDVVFIDRLGEGHPAAIRSYRPSTRKVRTISALTEVFSYSDDIGVSVSRDGRFILYSQLDRSGSNVFVADNVR